jgi:hypothetical protein
MDTISDDGVLGTSSEWQLAASLADTNAEGGSRWGRGESKHEAQRNAFVVMASYTQAMVGNCSRGVAHVYAYCTMTLSPTAGSGDGECR